MRPTFMGLETMKRGIMVNQKALDIVGNNISNVKTKGYTRQRLDTVSVHSGGGSRIPTSSISLAGQGVEAVGVSQIRNSFLDSKFRQEYGDVGYYDQRAAMLSEIEEAISDPEVEGTGIKDALTTLLTAMTKFSENPYQETQANIVMASFTGLTQTIRQYSQKLDTIRRQQTEDLEISVDDINSKFEQLAELNEAIANEVFSNTDYDGVNYGPNELLDKRNLILDDLARYGELQVKEQDGGGMQVIFNGHVAVDGSNNQYHADKIEIGDNGTDLRWQGNQKEVDIQTGVLKGYMDVLNGSNAIEKGLPYYQEKLDDLARGLAEAFNNVIPNDNGADGYKTLLEGEDGVITAGNLTVSADWLADSTYVIQKNPEGAMDTTNVLNMKNLLDKDLDFGGEFTGTFSEFVTYIVTSLGSDITLNNSRLDASVITAESIEKDRNSVSGVSLNEEGIQMMTYNKAYQALARMMTTMDEQLDVLINKMGMVGR